MRTRIIDKYTFPLYNFFAVGSESTAHSSTEYLGLLRLDLLGTKANIQLEKNVVTRRTTWFSNSPRKVQTGIIEIFTTELTRAKEISSDLCDLLSLASCSTVSNGERLSGMGAFRPSLTLTNGKEIQSFVEVTYKNYQKFKNARKLKQTIPLLVQCVDNKNYMEHKLSLIFTLIENLKWTFAKSSNFPTNDDQFFYYKSNPKKQVNFRKMLSFMLEESGQEVDDTLLDNIKSWRNELLHTALFDGSLREMRRVLDISFQFSRDYLIRLLGYGGKLNPYSR